MKNRVLSFLLHHANRYSKSTTFYAVKDKILKLYGCLDGYDVQKLPGKICRSCGGSGQYAKYSMHPPYKIYDYADCWHCIAGYYRLPRFVCLQRYKFGPYLFHKPLKSEEAFKNPFTKEELGWEVSERPVIAGYVEHQHSRYGQQALLILFLLYDRTEFRHIIRYKQTYYRFRIKGIIARCKKIESWLLYRPLPFVLHWFDAKGEAHRVNDEHPF